MTTLQKTLITATIVTVVGTGIYEARQASVLQTRFGTLQQQQAPLTAQIQQLRREHEEALAVLAVLQKENGQLRDDNLELVRLRSEIARLRNDSQELAALKEANKEFKDDPATSAWLARVDQFKKHVMERPEANTPELQFATQQDWLEAAKDELDTDEAYRRALGALRMFAGNRFAKIAQSALRKYIRANEGQFPTEISQLKSYFEPPIDEAVLQRYEVASAGKFDQAGPGDRVIVTKEPVDKEYDFRTVIGANGYTPGYFDKNAAESSRAAVSLLGPAVQAYSKANYGLLPYDDLSELIPYLTTDEQRTALEQLQKSRPKKNQ